MGNPPDRTHPVKVILRSKVMLRLPYILNILILVPVCWAMFAGTGRTAVFENKIEWSGELATLVASLWFAILMASLVGLFWPRELTPILAAQVIYKTLFLSLVIYPLWKQGGANAVPMGITASFVLIVLTYPIAIWAAWKPT